MLWPQPFVLLSPSSHLFCSFVFWIGGFVLPWLLPAPAFPVWILIGVTCLPPASSCSAPQPQPGVWLVRQPANLLITLQQSEEGGQQKPGSSNYPSSGPGTSPFLEHPLILFLDLFCYTENITSLSPNRPGRNSILSTIPSFFLPQIRHLPLLQSRGNWGCKVMRYDGPSLWPFTDATLSDNIDIADGSMNPLSQSRQWCVSLSRHYWGSGWSQNHS